MGTLSEILDRTWWIERFFYRHHRLFGLFVIAGSLVMVAMLLTERFWAFGPVAFLTRSVPILSGLLWGLAIAILLIGIIVLARPSMLKGFESLANRHVAIFSGHSES